MGQTIVITGANRGIGLEHARAYAERGAKVYAAARDPDAAEELQALARTRKDNVIVCKYDASVSDAALALKATLNGAPVDVLLANAGVMGGDQQTLGRIDAEEFIETMRVNALAPLKLAEALAENVAQSGRRVLAFQSSLMGSIADNGSGGYYAYRCSKAALNMIAHGLARDLKSRNIISVTLHPGWVRTRMGGPAGKLSVADCVAAQQRLLERLSPSDSGKFFNYDGRELPW